MYIGSTCPARTACRMSHISSKAQLQFATSIDHDHELLLSSPGRLKDLFNFIRFSPSWLSSPSTKVPRRERKTERKSVKENWKRLEVFSCTCFKFVLV